MYNVSLGYSIQTKEELLRVLGLQEEQGSQLQFLRRGYKVTKRSSFVAKYLFLLTAALHET